MKIFQGFPHTDSYCGIKTILTIGTFDGVHLGHRLILKKVIESARESGKIAAVVTFDKHPGYVLNPDSPPKILTTLDEKTAIFDEIGIEATFVIHFTKEISEISADDFISKYLVKCLGMSHFIVGYDHGFGKNREGSTEILSTLSKKLNFNVDVMKPINYDGIPIKSSVLRDLVTEGEVYKASQLLGTDYSFRGNVIPGQGIGRKIGIPTANIAVIEPEKCIPRTGVYAGWIDVGGERKNAVLSIGQRPTFDNGKEEVVEAHIPGFIGDLYGQEVRAGFNNRIREIVKYDSSQELVDQIHKDIEILKQVIQT
ncbi:Bifunctional riboflavin kinase/FMN adenylyltransferase [subsurface metagenome]